MRAAIASTIIVALAAGGCQAKPAQGAPAPLVVAPIPAPAPPPHELARGEWDVAILDRDGSYWPEALVPDPPRKAVAKCVQGSDAVVPLHAGWALFALRISYDESPSRTTMLESSGLSATALSCLENALGALRHPQGLTTPPLLAYVAIR